MNCGGHTGSLMEWRTNAEARKLAANTDPQTSKTAAIDVVKSNLRDVMHGRIINAMQKMHKDMTAKEIAATIVELDNTGQHWTMVYHAVARRLNELVKSGDIEVVGERQSVVGNNGKMVQAYRIKQQEVNNVK